MLIYDNDRYREPTPDEVLAESQQVQGYWQSVPYEDAVDAQIRKRYSVSQEFAILRQKEEKPEEYAEYYAYCEQCKAFVKERKGI